MDEKTLFLRLARKHVMDIEREVRGVRACRDIEPLHRMRVAVRRLRSALSDFHDLCEDKALDPVAADLRKLLRNLGQARDMDTKIAFLKSLADSPPGEKHSVGIREIIEELEEDRGEIQPRIVKVLSRLRQRRALKAVFRLAPSLEDTGMTVEEWGKGRILTRLEKMLSYEPYVRKTSSREKLHKMRIAAKNLRYTLESLAPVFGRKLVPFARAAAGVQRMLGEMHNYDVWLELLGTLKDSSSRDAAFRKAVVFLTEECLRRRRDAHLAFTAQWAALKKRKTWPRLGFFAIDRP